MPKKKDGQTLAAEAAGGWRQLAAKLGVVHSTVFSWKRRNSVPAEWLVPIEKATGVPREQLRPELYR